MNKTLQGTLLKWFLTFSVIIILLFLSFNAMYIQQKSRITNVIGEIYSLHLNVQKDFNITDEFFTYEASNLGFFRTGKSELLEAHDQRLAKIHEIIHDLRQSALVSKMKVNADFDSLFKYLGRYERNIDQIVELTLQRGFKDYGIVGKMREFVHQLEGFPELDQVYVLGLRRHEKDYIIRNEQEYVDKLNRLGQTFIRNVQSDVEIPSAKKETITGIIENYLREFNHLVEVDRRIGLRSPENGKKSQLATLETDIEQRFNLIIEKSEKNKIRLFRYLEVFYISFFLVFLLISIFLSRAISKRIAAPLTLLTAHIRKLSGKNLRLEESLGQDFSNYETSVLYQEFRQLIEQIKLEKEELNRVQQALIENEEKYRQLADNLPQSVFETDQFGNFTYVNENWLRSFGYAREEIENGLNIIHILKAESGPIVLGDESGGSVEYQAIRKDGSGFRSLVYTNRIHMDDKLRGFRGAIIDITERVEQSRGRKHKK